MADIKNRKTIEQEIKISNKNTNKTRKIKEKIVDIKTKVEDLTDSDDKDINEYAIKRFTKGSKIFFDNSVKIKRKGNENVEITKKNIGKAKQKIKTIKTKLTQKKKQGNSIKAINKKNIKPKKVVNKPIKSSKRAIQVAKTNMKRGYKALKVTISSIRAIIMGTKALISALIAGGWIAIVVIIIVCLVGLLCSSIFGIFFSNEKINDNNITIGTVVNECNQEFSNKLQIIQDQTPHDDYVFEGSMANWKDILLIYVVTLSKGTNEAEVLNIDISRKEILKKIFWDMNVLSTEVVDEMIIEQGINIHEAPKEVQKKVLHIRISTKTLEQMISEYNLSSSQINQITELSKEEYSSLWNSLIYGSTSSESYNYWRQDGATWSNIRIGNTNSTIADIGCLVTSIAILIQKSGVNTASVVPFNPGTFVEALNRNSGFDNGGNLQYAPISKIIPKFQYAGHVNLRGKSKSEKLELITLFINAGYYITAEVKGATPGNQHWVAIDRIEGNDVIMIDPASNQTNMWSAYEFSKTSQFNYFKVN